MNKLVVLLFAVMLMLFNFSCNNNNQSANDNKEGRDEHQSSALNGPVKKILFFGNSLTAGYGLQPTEAFPSLIQAKLDSAGFKYKAVNAGVSGETSAGGNGRIDWILKQPLDIFVLELGANDGLRGIPVAETKSNLQLIINKVKTKYPKAKLVLAGMQVPPNMGRKYADDFREMFPELAKKNSMELVPFLLEGVGGVRELNQADGIHPTATGAKIVAENVWRVLQNILEK